MRLYLYLYLYPYATGSVLYASPISHIAISRTRNRNRNRNTRQQDDAHFAGSPLHLTLPLPLFNDTTIICLHPPHSTTPSPPPSLLQLLVTTMANSTTKCSLFLIIIIFFFFILLSTSTATATATASATSESFIGRFVGGRTQVENVQDNKEIQDLGRYCVRQYNLRYHHHQHLPRDINSASVSVPLVFSRVVAAETQVVAGLKYYLNISAATRGGTGPTRTFQAVLLVKPWLHSKQLLNFAPSSTPSYSSSSSS